MPKRRGWMLWVLVLAFLLRLYAAETEDRQSPDTYHYARQAQALRTQGLDGWRDEARRFAGDPAMLAVPAVTRTVFLAALAGWMQITNTSGITSTAAFSCFLDITTAVLLALLAAAILGDEAAAVAVLLYAVSPFPLCLARHGWSDTLGAVFCLLNLLLALRCLGSSRERWPRTAFAGSLALSFGVKEGPFVQACLVLAVTLLLLLRTRRRMEALQITTFFATFLLLMLGWTAFAVGGFQRVFQMYGSGRDPNAVVPYLVEYQNGSAFDWLRALWLTDPVVCTFSTIGLSLVALKARRLAVTMPAGLLFCAAICFIFPLLPMFGHQLYNVRYETPALAPACLLAAYAFREVWIRLAKNSPYRLQLAIVALAVCAGVSLWRYDSLIARPDLQDLSLKMVLSGHN